MVPAFLALVTFVALLDIFQLVCAVIGALLYSLIYVPTMPKGPRSKSKTLNLKTDSLADLSIGNTGAGSKPLPTVFAKPAVLPIKAPTFAASEFEAQVDEFIGRITPTPSCHKAVEELTAIVRSKIQSMIPEAEVIGFTTGDLRGGTAYGVAVPDVDIVMNVSPMDLAKRLQGRLQQVSRARSDAVSRLAPHKLQKSAIRVCTSLLVSAGFKFRRSSFRSEAPKVTLLAPPAMGASDVAIPVNFSINNSTPLYNMALLTECGQMDPRAKSLILLVKRWAKDRGICHASQGHLPPYAWSLLAIYFLQVGLDDADGCLPLPAVSSFEVGSGLLHSDGPAALKRNGMARRPAAVKATKRTMAELLKEFVRFYKWEFNWRNEAVSVLSGKRAPPNLYLEIHVVLHDDGTTSVCPTIEDPFDAKTNLGRYATAASLQRLFEELERADNLLTEGTSLTKLLEPWRPPEPEKTQGLEDSDHSDNED